MRFLLPLLGAVSLLPLDAAAAERSSQLTSLVVNSKGVRRCYERELLRVPTTWGKLELRITLRPSGRVQEVSRVRSAGWVWNIEACVMRAVGRIRFPPGGDAEVFDVPLIFTVPP